jgi:transcriptional regulator with XRE-family HTH domain
MEKSLFTREHQVLTELLRDVRARSGMTQIDLAKKLKESQSYISKWERGVLRLDLVQVRNLCQALGMTLQELVVEYEKRLGGKKRS